MNARSRPVIQLLVCLIVVTCARAPAAESPAALSPTATTSTRAASPTPAASPSLASVASSPAECQAGAGETTVTVDAKANIFGAGKPSPPAPAHGGGGVLPPGVELPSDAGVVVTFTCTAGLTNCCEGAPDTPAGGDLVGPTDVSSYDGISGLAHDTNGMFLAGVFIGPDEPRDPAPEPLDFTDECTSSCTFDNLAPQLGQTFFIGSGGPARYMAPTGATRLFLGFVDGYLYRGLPGWYDNNRGQLSVTLHFGSR